jgi:hypothetical protein
MSDETADRTVAAETHLESSRDDDLRDPQFGLDELHTGEYQPFEDDAPSERTDLIDSIGTDGIRVPILVDQEGTVIDGNHRVTLATQLPKDGEFPEIETVDDIPYRLEVLDEDLPEMQKYERAIEQNVTRRNHDDDTKAASIRRYITRLDTRGIYREDAEIGDLYGVSSSYAGRIRRSLVDDGKIRTESYFTQRQKRGRIHDELMQDPGANNSEIADRVGFETTRQTVGNIRASMDETPATAIASSNEDDSETAPLPPETTLDELEAAVDEAETTLHKTIDEAATWLAETDGESDPPASLGPTAATAPSDQRRIIVQHLNSVQTAPIDSGTDEHALAQRQKHLKAACTILMDEHEREPFLDINIESLIIQVETKVSSIEDDIDELHNERDTQSDRADTARDHRRAVIEAHDQYQHAVNRLDRGEQRDETEETDG